jgi:hypothetical protein
MGKKVSLTYKQERQIVSFFENSHAPIACPDNIDNSGIIALFRACRDYCKGISGAYGYGRSGKVPSEEREKYRHELLEKLEMLSIRYYMKI